MGDIHKTKNGRLHIYVRQDKYKDKLKSHNWVGRTYINGQQKIISSGTTFNAPAIISLLPSKFNLLIKDLILAFNSGIKKGFVK